MNLILTMAGKYQRFKDKGYKIPKYLLPWGNKCILSEIISQFRMHFNNIYLVANKADNIYLNHVNAILNYYSIPEKNLFIIDDTSGQAETANIYLNLIEQRKPITEPVVFHNIDTILYDRDYKKIESILDKNSGFIDVFQVNDNKYSFVLVNQRNNVKDIKEKQMISSLASSGFYGFKTVEKFREYYDKNHKFISEIYDKMINNGEIIKIDKINDEENTVVLGTPSEYIAKTNNFI